MHKKYGAKNPSGSNFHVLLFVFFFLPALRFSLAAQDYSALEHCVQDASAPVVYFTKDISAAGLLKVYNALNQKISGNVAVKVSFGGHGEQVLDAKLLSQLLRQTGGTMVDCSGLSGDRWTSAMNLALAKENGFSAVGPVQMLDENGDLDMPVRGGRLLKYARTGKHFDEYDTVIAVHRFKLHYLPALGGNIKNISLCLGSRSGKCLIHSGGTDEKRFHNTAPDVLAQAFADAAKAALDYKKNWAFVSVLDRFSPEDSCRGTKDLGDIGIIASYDVVAIDQCAADFEIGLSAADAETKAAWETQHQLNVLDYAEQIGCGKRSYRFVNLDK
ncbi:MAG: DUF362 domain-containing protein [Bacteroides sp.]|nr:DUF362 domain-containing protein [Prevotella sp.]MCM1408900.1 DUF362 domain-containing protein [Treponema brennaborense]MCM1470827.1 DUF362 domain-containing protein [Bacteroides sp.]